MLYSSAGTLLPLGTGGWMATAERETSAYLWQRGNRTILLDAGSGLRRLGDCDCLAQLQATEKIYLFLSHYHLDHTIGFTFLSRFLKPEQTLVICAPDRTLCYYNPREALEMMLRMPFYHTPFPFLPFHTEIKELHLGENDVDGMPVTVWPQKHSDTSVGYAFDSTLAYISDTSVLARAMEPCNGVRWLLHEVYYDPTDVAELDRNENREAILHHSCDTEVAEFALQCAAGNLIPIHFNPTHSRERYVAQIERLADSIVDLTIPEDGKLISLG
ncbi:MAG: MBL fold metallo-hydrolase [bacterium]|nr:MBL fold metallo-hydrolase [bacterium]